MLFLKTSPKHTQIFKNMSIYAQYKAKNKLKLEDKKIF